MGTFLVIGSATALGSAKCAEVVALIQERGLVVELCSAPASLKRTANEYSHMLLVIDNSMPPMADMWGAFFKKFPTLVSVAMVKTTVPGAFQKFFKFQHEWLFDEPNSIVQISEWLNTESASATPEGYESATAVVSEPDLDVFMAPSEEFKSPSLGDEIAIEVDALSDDHSNDFAKDNDDYSQVDDFADMLGGDNAQPESSIEESIQLLDVIPDGDVGLEAAEQEPSPASDPSLLIENDSAMKDLSEEPVLSSIQDLGEGEPTEDVGGQTSQVVKRYALLKEKENREKQKTIDILRSELEKAKATLQAIQSDKRRAMLKVEDIEADRRALQETVDELRHKLSLSDSETTQKIKDYQTRLENSQFLAKRFEKKLEDFKLRVRLDIQKIRARERELENRLELQKRDAEALISTKDSRLLNQKREIDKMQFEMEILKERLVEETERAEDRNEKLHRASQSLKMAQGMLSGIDEEVISTSERDSGDGSGDEAA